jgi:hypothetical protein
MLYIASKTRLIRDFRYRPHLSIRYCHFHIETTAIYLKQLINLLPQEIPQVSSCHTHISSHVSFTEVPTPS